MEETDHGLF